MGVSKIIRVAKVIVEGGPADIKIQESRLAKCRDCITNGRPTLTNDGKHICCGTCLSPIEGLTCGCEVKEKVQVISSKCPQGKW